MILYQVLVDECKAFIAYSAKIKAFNVVFLLWALSLPDKNTVYQVTTLLIPLFFFAAVAAERSLHTFLEFFNRYKDIGLALAVILFSMALSNILGEHTNTESWWAIAKFIQRYILVFFSLLYLYEKRYFSIQTIAIAAIISVAPYALHGLYQVIASGGTRDALSIIYNRNPYALVMMTGIMVATLSFLHLNTSTQKDRTPYLLLLVVFIFSVALIYCRSRSGWISTALFFSVTLLVQKNVSKTAWLALCFISLALLGFGLFDDRIANRLGNLFYDKARMVDIWPYMVQLIQEHPLFGYGLVDFKSLTVGKYYHGTHNSVLEVLLYTGSVGCIAFSIPVIVTLREIIRSRQQILLSCFIAFFVLSLFNLSVFGNKIFLSILSVFLVIVFSKRAHMQTASGRDL